MLVGSVAIAPITVFAVAPAFIGATIVLTSMPTAGTLNSEIKIPKGISKLGNTEYDGLTVEVLDPHGNKVTYQESGDYYKFTPKLVGNYKVTYTAAESGSYKSTSETFTIAVTSTKATLELPTNSEFILQNKVGKDSAVVLPYPTAMMGEEEIEDAEFSIKVRDPKHNTWVAGGTKEGYTNPLTQKNYGDEVRYIFKAGKEGEEVIYGTYSIVYSYQNPVTEEITTKSYSIVVSPNYSTDKKITFTWNGSLPESAVLGNETTLPSPITVDANNNGTSVETYTKVIVEYYDSSNTLIDGNIKVENFKFTPKYQAKGGSYYKLTYKIYTLEDINLANYDSVEAALNAADQADHVLIKTYSLTNVTDTVAPIPQVVDDYAINTDQGVKTIDDNIVERLKDEDVSYAIPTKVATDKEIEIPAIYATDNYNVYNDITLSRTLLDENNVTYNLDGETTLNSNNDSPIVVQAAQNSKAKVTFKKAGTYTVRYRATDAANNQKDISYTIVVADNFEDKVAPTIKLPTIVATARPNDTISFAEATVVDYEADESSTATVDANVRKDVYYIYGNVTTGFEELKENGDLTKISKDAKTSLYTFDVENQPESNYLTIAFRAEDDAKYTVKNEGGEILERENNIAWNYKVVRIYNVNDDVVPTLESGLDTVVDATYSQGETVNIGEIRFRDKDNDTVAEEPETYTTNYLTAALKVYDKNGKEIKVKGVQYVYDGTYLVVKGGKFVTTVAADKADEFYTVVITATDLGGNSLVNSAKFQVKDTKAPVVEVDSVETTMELGKTYVLPTPVVVDDGEEIENTANSVIEFGAANPSYEYNHATNEFTPKEEGTYTFRFVGQDDADPNPNVTYTNWYSVTVKDTIQPVIYIDENSGYTVPETAAYKDAEGEKLPVELPLFSATDEYNDIETIEVAVKGPNGDDIKALNKGDHYEFTPVSNGVYTVTYKAVDKAGNSATQSYSVKVGDVTAPTITIETSNVPGTYNIGDSMSIDLEKLKTVDDNDGTKEGPNAYNDGLKIKLVGPDGDEVTLNKQDNILTYEFEKSGTYSLTYTATDAAGNSDDVVYSFEVKARTNTTSVAETVWGVVLVVASIALLAGVVIYFVKTKDVADTKEKNKQ